MTDFVGKFNCNIYTYVYIFMNYYISIKKKIKYKNFLLI